MHEKHKDPFSLPQTSDHNAKQDWEKHENKEQGKIHHEIARSKNHKATQNKKKHQDHRLGTVGSITYRGCLKHFYCRQIITLGPDVILNTKMHTKFGSHNGSLTQSMHIMKTQKSTSYKHCQQRLKKTLVEPRGPSQRHGIKPQSTYESFMKRPSLSLRPEPPPCN